MIWALPRRGWTRRGFVLVAAVCQYFAARVRVKALCFLLLLLLLHFYLPSRFGLAGSAATVVAAHTRYVDTRYVGGMAGVVVVHNQHRQDNPTFVRLCPKNASARDTGSQSDTNSYCTLSYSLL